MAPPWRRGPAASSRRQRAEKRGDQVFIDTSLRVVIHLGFDAGNGGCVKKINI
jgi:hypothetical protein